MRSVLPIFFWLIEHYVEIAHLGVAAKFFRLSTINGGFDATFIGSISQQILFVEEDLFIIAPQYPTLANC